MGECWLKPYTVYGWNEQVEHVSLGCGMTHWVLLTDSNPARLTKHFKTCSIATWQLLAKPVSSCCKWVYTQGGQDSWQYYLFNEISYKFVLTLKNSSIHWFHIFTTLNKLTVAKTTKTRHRLDFLFLVVGDWSSWSAERSDWLASAHASSVIGWLPPSDACGSSAV